MADAAYTPTALDGVSLTASPFNRVFFRDANGPGQTRPSQAIESNVPGFGVLDVRSQPGGVVWELHAEIDSMDESDWDAMLAVFSEDRGLVFLQADDSAGTGWRVACRVLQVQYVSPRYVIAQIRVANPKWEETSLTTDTQADISGDDSGAFALTNNGNRNTKPTYSIEPDTVKATTIISDYIDSTRGFILNQTKRVWNDQPVQLFDADGADGVLDHAALVTGSVRALINEGGGIDDNQNTIVFDTGQNGNPPVSGMAMLGSEQIYYTGGGGGTTGTLTGVVRGIGGTTAATHADSSNIEFSKALANADDLRVWANGVEVPRFVGGANTATCKLWINATMPARQLFTLQTAMTAGAPATGGELLFDEEVDQLAPRGVLGIQSEGANAVELVAYTGKTIRGVTGIVRGAWGTTAGIHAVAAPVLRADILYVIGSNRPNAGVPPAPAARRPAIQLPTSTNGRWFWGDVPADTLTVFFDVENPNRTAMWIPSGEQHPEDVAVPLRMPDQKGDMDWEDDVPAAGASLATRMTVDIPQGVKAEGSAIQYDLQGQRDIRMRLLGIDAEGNEVELADVQEVDATLLTNQTITPSDNYFQVVANGVRGSVCGSDATGLTAPTLNTAPEDYQFKFILNQDTDLFGIQLQLKDNATGTMTFQVAILDDSGADPSLGKSLIEFDIWADDAGGSGFGPDFSQAVTDGTYKIIQFASSEGSIRLAAGTYWIEVHVSAVSSATMITEAGVPTTQHNILSNNGSEVAAMAAWFRVMHAHNFPVQIEAGGGVLDGSVVASFDDLEIEMNLKPYVDVGAGLANTLYHCVGTIDNAQTGQDIAVDEWMALDDTLVINCEKKTVVHTSGSWSYPQPSAITPTDLESWNDLEPGSNSMTYIEDDMVDTEFVTTFRGNKV